MAETPAWKAHVAAVKKQKEEEELKQQRLEQVYYGDQKYVIIYYYQYRYIHSYSSISSTIIGMLAFQNNNGIGFDIIIVCNDKCTIF